MQDKMKDLNSTFLFKQFDETIGITKKVTTVMSSDPTIYRYEDFLDEFKVMDRYTFPGKNSIITQVKRGNIKMLYSVVEQIPSAIHTLLTVNHGDYGAYTNISNYAGMDSNGKIKIDTISLYTLLNFSAIDLAFHTQFRSISRDANLRKYAMHSYVNLFMRVLNKLYSLNVNPTSYDKVAYLVAKFFLINLAGMEDGKIVDDTAKIVSRDTHTKILDMADIGMSGDAYTSIDKFIHALSKTIPNLSNITLREVTNDYMKTYGTNTVLALEYYPALVAMLTTVVTGVRLNKKDSIETAVGKIGVKCFEHFMSNYVAKMY